MAADNWIILTQSQLTRRVARVFARHIKEACIRSAVHADPLVVVLLCHFSSLCACAFPSVRLWAGYRLHPSRLQYVARNANARQSATCICRTIRIPCLTPCPLP